MQYLRVELKSCVKEQLKDSETGLIYNEIVEKPLIKFDLEHPFGNHNENIYWRTSIWNLAVYRSLEIWKSLPNIKIEKSIGTLSEFAQKSLKGKLGSGNKKYFQKEHNGNWAFIQFKENKYENIFKPFSDNAISICRSRARRK